MINRCNALIRASLLLLACLVISVVSLQTASAFADDENQDHLPARYSSEADSFHSYLPSYMGYSLDNSVPGNKGELKFQFSVKYELIADTDWYFGYTQKSFWSIRKESAPFRETNFSPETFWLYKPEGISWLPVVQVGMYRHESTGEDGNGSRGWDLTYLEPAFHWNGIYVIARVWAPSVVQGFNKTKAAPDNPDIFKYQGYGRLTVIYGNDSDVQLSLSLQHAPTDNSIAWESQADVPWKTVAKILRPLFGIDYIPKWNPSYFIQARNGYGEGLKTYNVKTSSVVFGVSLVR